jgi:hypothetical protein
LGRKAGCGAGRLSRLARPNRSSRSRGALPGSIWRRCWRSEAPPIPAPALRRGLAGSRRRGEATAAGGGNGEDPPLQGRGTTQRVVEGQAPLIPTNRHPCAGRSPARLPHAKPRSREEGGAKHRPDTRPGSEPGDGTGLSRACRRMVKEPRSLTGQYAAPLLAK